MLTGTFSDAISTSLLVYIYSSITRPNHNNCEQPTGEVWANDCGVIGGMLSFNEGVCGTYTGGVHVDCDGSGNPTTVYTPGGNFGNCVDSGSTGYGSDCSAGPGNYAFAHWCCSRI